MARTMEQVEEAVAKDVEVLEVGSLLMPILDQALVHYARAMNHQLLCLLPCLGFPAGLTGMAQHQIDQL